MSVLSEVLGWTLFAVGLVAWISLTAWLKRRRVRDYDRVVRELRERMFNDRP